MASVTSARIAAALSYRSSRLNSSALSMTREQDALGAADLGMSARPGRARLKRAEEHSVVELDAPVLSLEEREFRMVTVPELATRSRIDGAVALDQDGAHQRAGLAVGARLGDRLLHDGHGAIHHLAGIEPLLGGHQEVLVEGVVRRLASGGLNLGQTCGCQAGRQVEDNRRRADK